MTTVDVMKPQIFWSLILLLITTAATKQQWKVSKAMSNTLKAEEEIRLEKENTQDEIKLKDEREEKSRLIFKIYIQCNKFFNRNNFFVAVKKQ